MKHFLFLSIFILILSISKLFGQSIVTDRPNYTESSVTVPKGSLQIESGLIFAFNEEGFSLMKEISLPSSLFRVGITKGIELRIFNQYEKIIYGNNTISGFGDIEIGTKIQILRNDNFQMAFISHLVTPTGTAPLSNDTYGTINKLAAAYRFSDGFASGINVGYSHFGEGNGNLLYSLSLGFSVNEKASLYIEPYGEFTNLEDFISNIDGGITYLISDNLQADISFGTGITYRMNYFACGLSWRILKN